MIVDKDKDPDLHQHVHDRNLLRQYDLLKDFVDIALKQADFVITEQLLFDLNHIAAINLCPHAGNFRPHDVKINRSPHQPPPWMEVKRLTHEFVVYLQRNWNRDALWLAAYCLWRINWIHPFAEGNGRTARAVSYFVLCVKYGMWLPGAQIIPQQIRNDRKPYYAALRHADDNAEADGATNLNQMVDYLSRLLKTQLTGI